MVSLKFDCVDRRLKKLFYTYGIFISRHPWPLIILSLISATIFCAGLTVRQRKVWDFQNLHTPDEAPSKSERNEMSSKWQSIFDDDGDSYSPEKMTSDDGQCKLLVTAKDGGDVLRPEITEALKSLNNFVINKILITEGPYQYSYQNLCYKKNDKCYTEMDDKLEAITSAIVASNLTYPWTRTNLHKYYVPGFLGGIVIAVNEKDDLQSPVQSARAWLLSYQLSLSSDDDETVESADRWRSRFVEVLRSYNDPLINVAPYHSKSLNEKMSGYSKTIYQLYIICTLLLSLCIFTLTSGAIFVRRCLPVIDWTYSKPLIALGAVTCLVAGVTSSFGLLAFMKIQYNELFSIVPFIMISTICEQVFLLVNVYRSTDRSLPVDKRMGVCAKRACPPALITTLSDLACLSTASFLSTPAARLFCIYACFCVALTFLFSLILLLPIFSLSVRLEEKRKHALCCWIETNDVAANREIDCFQAGSRNCSENQWINNFFRTKFVTFLNRSFVKAPMFAVFLASAAVCLYYATTRHSSGLESRDLVPGYSYVNEYLNLYEKHFLSSPGFVRVQISVNSAPDLSYGENRREIRRLIDEAKFAIGRVGGEIWLDDFDEFLRESGNNVSMTSVEYYTKIREFLSVEKYARYADNIAWGDLRAGQNPSVISMFRFYVGVANFVSIRRQVRVVDAARRVAANFTKFDVSTFAYEWMSCDRTKMAPWNALMTACGQFACMAILCLLFIPHLMVSICSIMCTALAIGIVYGFATFMQISLNSLSTIVQLAVTVVTVHFNLHVSYAYCNVVERTVVERLRRCLATVGWPFVQTLMTSLICVSVLYTYDDYYVVSIAWRMQIFTISACCLIAVMLLPVFLMMTVGQSWCFVQNISDISSIHPADHHRTPPTAELSENETFLRFSLPTYSNVRLPRLSRSLNDVPNFYRQPCFTAKTDGFFQTTQDRPLTSETLPLATADGNLRLRRCVLVDDDDDRETAPKRCHGNNDTAEDDNTVLFYSTANSEEFPEMEIDAGRNSEVFSEIDQCPDKSDKACKSIVEPYKRCKSLSTVIEEKFEETPAPVPVTTAAEYTDVERITVPLRLQHFATTTTDKASPSGRNRLLGERRLSSVDNTSVRYANELY